MPDRSSSSSPDAPKKVRVNRESLRQMLSLFVYIRPYRGRLYLGLVLLILTSIMGSAFPFFARVLINSKTHEHAFHVVLFILSVLAVQAVLTFISSYNFSYVGENGLASLRRALFSHLTEMPLSFFNRNQVGELISRFSADLTQLQDAFVFAIPQFLRQSIIFIVSLVMMFYLSASLTGVMLACFPPTIIVALILGRQVGKHSRHAQDELARATNVVEEALQGIASVKAYANEIFEQNRYASFIGTYLIAILKTAKMRAALIAFIIFGIFTAIVVVLWYGTTLLIDGKIKAGDLFGFAIYTAFVGGSIGSFSDLYSNLQKSIGATTRVRELLAEPAENLDQPTTLLSSFRGDVILEGITFAYPSRSSANVLKNLSFSVQAGEIIALVGPSGAGKSTLVSLLLRFYEPQSGRLLFDGQSAASISRHALRGQMALVPQEVLLFGGTIAENIAYGKPGASQAEIEEAARRANAHDFITGFPEGYQTLVGERGIQVSGGQRQRLAIARALLKNPKILILDEATSALDAESERLVQQALDVLMQGRTCFVIAHRLSTIRNAHRILVLKDGSVAESGTHEELLALPEGIYREMVNLQQGGEFLVENIS